MIAIRKLNLAVMLLALVSGAALADTVELKANLQPSSEVPHVSATGTVRWTRHSIPPRKRCNGP